MTKTLLLYLDNLAGIEKLTDEERGKIFAAIIEFSKNREEILEDRFLKIIFEPIKNSIIRDSEKYEKIVEAKKIAGKKGGKKSGKVRAKAAIEAKEASASKSKQIEANGSKRKQTEANEAKNKNKNKNEEENIYTPVDEKNLKNSQKNEIQKADEKKIISAAEKVFAAPKKMTDEARKKFRARLKNFTADEIAAAFRNLEKEPDKWKFLNNGFRSLAWWLHSDERILEMQNCHLKKISAQNRGGRVSVSPLE